MSLSYRSCMISLLVLAIFIVLGACSGEIRTPESPTFTPLPSRTPRPSQTPTLTKTPLPTATITSTPKPTIQLPKQALTPLPFTPELISVENAWRIIELTRWEVTNPAFWQKPDGSSALAGIKDFTASWDFQLAFSLDGTSLTLLPASGGGLYFSNNFCTFSGGQGVANIITGKFGGGNYLFPGVPHLSIPVGQQIKLTAPDVLKSFATGSGEYFYSSNGKNLVIKIKSTGCQFQSINLETGSGSSSKIIDRPGDYYHPNDGLIVDSKIFWVGPGLINDEIAFFNPSNGEQIQKTVVKWRHLAELTKAEAERINRNSASQQQLNNNHNQVMEILALSPDSKNFISSIHLDNFYLWNEVTKSIDRPKGKLRIVLWRINDGAMMSLLVDKEEWKDEPIAAYSPDSRQAAIYIDASLKIGLYDLASGKQTGTLGRSGYLSLAYAFGGKILVGETEKSLELWDIATGKLLAAISFPSMLDSWAISPDSRYIATITEDGRISLWGVMP